MYTRIMTPLDLSHADRMEKAVRTSVQLSKAFDIPITFVGVTSNAPSSVAHNASEYASKLTEYANSVAEAEGITVDAHPVLDQDPTADLDRLLLRLVDEVGADLVVMASHLPGLLGGRSHGSHLAKHAKVSVLIVRG